MLTRYAFVKSLEALGYGRVYKPKNTDALWLVVSRNEIRLSKECLSTSSMRGLFETLYYHAHDSPSAAY